MRRRWILGALLLVSCGGDDGGGGDSAGDTAAVTTADSTSASGTADDDDGDGAGTAATGSADGDESTAGPDDGGDDGVATTTGADTGADTSGDDMTDDGGGSCEPEAQANACLMCAVPACCDAWTNCQADAGCACVVQCHVVEGGSLGGCESQCDSDGELYQALFFCGQQSCLNTCEWDCC